MSDKRYSKIANNYPSFQDIGNLSLNCYKWMNSRRADDNAEDLWRIHDKLYDLTDFVDAHPGGQDWITLTKGTDITEAFEVHHINADKVETLLPTFFVRQAAKPRNFTLTFKENGFYRTLKRRIANALLTIDKRPETNTKFLIDGLLAATIVCAILAVRLHSTILLIAAALTLSWTVISAHNYFHRRDNFRMFYFNLSFMSYREWRISHAMSHHLYPNSLHDLEVSLFEPFLCYVTNAKTKGLIQRYGSWLYGPIVYLFLFADQFIKRIAISLKEQKNLFQTSDAIPFCLPAMMYIFGGNIDAITIVKMWLFMIFISSFYFGFVGLNAGHHNHHCVHDGDILRDNTDWGLYTLDTVIDNSALRKSHFLALTNFGHHALHHLLPTLDHGILPQLYPVLYQTMHEFDTELEEFPWFFHICGQLKQLARIEPTDYSTRVQKRLDYAQSGRIN